MGELRSLSGEIITPNDFLDPYSPTMGALTSRCIEDRPVDIPVMVHGLQITAGAAGEGAAFTLAIEAADSGIFVGASRTIDEWGNVIVKSMRGVNHENCAGRDGRERIIGLIATQPDLVYKTAREIQPNVDERTFGRIVDAAERISGTSLAVVGELPESSLAPLQKDKHGKVVSHAAQRLIAIEATEGDHVLWNTRAAWEAGFPAYGANVGLYPGRAIELNNKVGSIMGHRVGEEAFAVAAVAYLASTVHHLPRFNDGQAPAVVRVPAA